VIVGNSLKDNFKGYQAWAFSASSADLKIIHLKADKKYLLMNAKLESQLVGYTIFKGENPVTPEV
jgi:23S rRNA G2445 N2-methylase RlmL